MRTLVRERVHHQRDDAAPPRFDGADAEALMAVLQAMQTRVMVADLSFDLVFVNDLAMRTLRGLEPQLIASFGVTVWQYTVTSFTSAANPKLARLAANEVGTV